MTMGLPNQDYLERAIGVVIAKWMPTTPTVSGGNGMTVFNNYRAKGEANAPFQAFSAPTVTATGAALLTNLIAGGTSVQTRIGANARPNDEIILLPSKNYLLRVNNSSGSSIAIGILISGYTQ